ncbi:MAG: TonB C-terminal domain-containing protein [Candidatus Omnitrophica bacterium]|nr:TonB C-terminal domain-containing protein [Candidatus Omnitrophota bacterium]MDD5552741.1 TonB C-terminal domain-containing protein [Candidatus Omnitrophota bacterium]
MFSNNAFRIALIVSAIAHGFILFQNPNFNLNLFRKDKVEQPAEVSYLEKIKVDPPKIAAPKTEPLLKLSSKITSKTAPPPSIDKEKIFKSKEMIARQAAFSKPSLPNLAKPDIIAVKKKISLPPIDMHKINNPSYITYYQIVREKIRRAAYQNYTRTEIGDAYLTFLILSDGSLSTIRLVEEKSSPSQYLREIALRSIKEASPFPAFPSELDYPQLSFNVVISFEVE